tara:strand:- start:272 stop:574 length:303 start_codon:yes stop_codon:yes gene_type:complete
MTDICPDCQGYGLVHNKEPIKCPCPYAFCYKCENREGYILKPWDECPKCFGTGVLEFKDVIKPIVKPSDISKPKELNVPQDITKPRELKIKTEFDGKKPK